MTICLKGKSDFTLPKITNSNRILIELYSFTKKIGFSLADKKIMLNFED